MFYKGRRGRFRCGKILFGRFQYRQLPGGGRSCTRAQVVTFLWRAAGCPEPESSDNPFDDVSESDWFCKPVLWAVEEGITDGASPTLFSPTTRCKKLPYSDLYLESHG
ncbi:MAG: S-layer homology domain-containing protein [Firmicutes bacterium]|nr:S-layer homology domain-containing protein [Bacillota bacterium]